MDGYNQWHEYPDEIDPGTLIKLGGDYVEVVSVQYYHMYYIITFKSASEDGPFGEIQVTGSVQLETFTKQPE